jgi:hypothetical protein
VSAQRIAVARLHRQHLATTPTLTSAVDVVRALGAVQSQDFAGACWAIGMRSTGVAEAAVHRAFDDGEILRTHVLRPTWHFVPAEDLAWMQQLTGGRVVALMASYNRTLGLTPAVYRKSRAVIERALTEQPYLTRTQLKAALDRARINTEGTQRLAHLVMQAEVDGLICSGPRMGKQHTYALLSTRAPSPRRLDGDEALAELTRRYFASRAPATVQDFAWWSGLTVSRCRAGVQLLGRELVPLTIDDVQYHVPPEFELPRAANTSVHLLPNYDEFFIGYRDRSAIAQRLQSVGLVTGGSALIGHVVTVGGQLVGGWKRITRESSTEVVLALQTALSPAERRRLDARVTQLQAFVGRGD